MRNELKFNCQAIIEKIRVEGHTDNTPITKKFENCWFLIDSMEIDKSSWRYKWDGDIVSGIVKYFQLLDFIVKETKR